MILGWALAALGADLAIYGDQVLPVNGPPIAFGVVVVQDGRITAVGPAKLVAVPEGTPEVRGAVVTPGFVDGLTVAGLTGRFNKPFDQDHREPGAAVAPQMRAIDAYDPSDELVGWLLRHGVTTLQVGPSPGVPVGGTTAIVSASPQGEDSGAGMVVFTLGEEAKAFPGAQTRMGSAAVVRQALAEANEYRERRKLPLATRAPVDLGLDSLVEVLERRRKAVFVAHRASDLITAVEIIKAFGLDGVLAGATEAYLVRDALAAAKVPVLVGPPMARQWSSEGETHDGTFENAALLQRVGIPIGFATGYESYVPKVRVVPFEAAIAAANGLGPELALKAATLGTAQILGISGRVGSIEVGKEADLAVFDGDPFEYRTHVCAVVADGVLVSDRCW